MVTLRRVVAVGGHSFTLVARRFCREVARKLSPDGKTWDSVAFIMAISNQKWHTQYRRHSFIMRPLTKGLVGLSVVVAVAGVASSPAGAKSADFTVKPVAGRTTTGDDGGRWVGGGADTKAYRNADGTTRSPRTPPSRRGPTPRLRSASRVRRSTARDIQVHVERAASPTARLASTSPTPTAARLTASLSSAASPPPTEGVVNVELDASRATPPRR